MLQRYCLAFKFVYEGVFCLALFCIFLPNKKQICENEAFALKANLVAKYSGESKGLASSDSSHGDIADDRTGKWNTDLFVCQLCALAIKACFPFQDCREAQLQQMHLKEAIRKQKRALRKVFVKFNCQKKRSYSKNGVVTFVLGDFIV